MVLHDINVTDPVLAAPSGYNVCLRVGGMDVIIGYVLKFDVIGLVQEFLSWLAENPCLKIIKVCVWCRLQ